MAVQVQDVVFKFEDSCNCCWRTPLKDHDPVYVTPRGAVRKFDFKAKPSADVNARLAIANLQARLTQLSETQAQMHAILAAIGQQLNLNIVEDTRILRVTEVRRIAAIALPLFRAPSPEPMALVRSPKSRDLSADLHSEAEWEEV